MGDGRIGGPGGGAGRIETERADAASALGAPGTGTADAGAQEAPVFRDAARMQASGQAFQLAQMARLLEAGHGPGVADNKTSADLRAAAELAKKLADASNAPGPFKAANDALAKAAKQLGEKVISGGKWDDETTRAVKEAAEKLGKPSWSEWVKENHDPRMSAKSSANVSSLRGGKSAKTEKAGEKAKAKDAGPVPTKTSLDAITDFRQIDWESYKPTKGDKELAARWAKLSPEEMKTELGKMSYRDRQLLYRVLSQVDKEAKFIPQVAQALTEVDGEPTMADTLMHGEMDRYSREYAEWLEQKSPADLEAWYQLYYASMGNETQTRIVELLENAAATTTGADRKAVIELKARLNALITDDTGAQVQTAYFKGLSKAEREAYIREAASTEQGAKTLAWQLQAVMVGDPKFGKELLAQAEDIFLADMKKTGKATLMLNFTLAAEGLHSGSKGSAHVKAAALQWIHNAFEPPKNDPRPWDKLFGPEFPRNRAADRIKSLLMSDPMGIARQLQIPPNDPQLLTQCMEDFANGYPEDPQKAGDAMSDVLDAVSTQLGKTAASKFEKVGDGYAFDAEAETLGFLLGAAHNAMDSYAEKWKGKVDHGAFILNIFAKGVAKISGVKAIEEVGKKIVAWQADREKKGIEKWQGEIKDKLFELVTARMWGQVPQDDHDAMTDAENAILHAGAHVSNGYERARKGAGRKVD